jgi:protein-disulfide isomerase
MSVRSVALCASIFGLAIALRVARASSATEALESSAANAIVEPTPPTLVLGSVGSPHRLVVFSDYECTVCALLERGAGAALRELAADGRLRMEVRHFPLSAHRRAPRAAAAAVCAERQARGWAMHEALLASASRWRSGPPAAPWFGQLADSLGLDRPSFDVCVHDPSVAEAIAADLALGRSLGLVGIPAVFLDGRPLTFRTPRALVRRVRRALG